MVDQFIQYPGGFQLMRYELLVNDEFWDDLYRELEQVKRRVVMQFMTFEGDEVGLKLAGKLIELRGKGIDVRVLIDRYTDFFISNKYYTDESVREEVARTAQMMEEMREAGIELRRTRPFGSPQVFFLARNHKKVTVIDDICYLGGINVSDHNYQWHDFMVRINDADLASAVTLDFNHGFAGEEKDFKHRNLITNRYLERTYYYLIENAREEIIISSPYIIDLHLVKIFKKKNVRKVLLTLKDNNYKLYNSMSNYLYSLLSRDGTEIFHYSDFSHAKFMIVDRKFLLIGSSNFGTESFDTKQEIGLVITDKEFIRGFIERMYTENLHHMDQFEPINGRFIPQRVLTHIIYYLMRFYGKTFVKLVRPIG